MNYTESHFLRLQDYIADGSKGELTPAERDYEDVLFSVAGIIRREGRPSARAWLMADRGCTRHVAERICWEAINLFYATDHVRAEAWRNLLFEKMLTAARLWEGKYIVTDQETGETTCKAGAKDFEAYAKIVKQAAALKRLSERADDPVPPTTNNLQVNVFSTSARESNLPATDKQAIMQNPYFKQLPKHHQERLEMEAGLTDFDLDKMLDDSIELANEVTGE